MKKLLIIMLSAIFILSLTFTGVGCKEEAPVVEEEAEAVVEEEAEAVVEEEAEAVVEEEAASGNLSMWLFGGYYNDWQQGTDWPFYEKYPEIKLDITSVDFPDNKTKFVSALAAGEGLPDILLQVTAIINEHASIGGLIDLTDKIEPYRDMVPEWVWESCSYEGKVYAVPVGGGPSVLYYRADIFEDAGIDIDTIETWQDLFEAGKKIYEATDGKTKLMTASVSGMADWAGEAIALQIMQEADSGIYDKDGNVIINNQKNVEILEFLKEVLDSGITLQEAYWSPANYSAIADGTIAVIPQGSWIEGHIKNLAPESEGKWGVTLLPAWEKGGSRYANNGGSVLAITSQCKDPELAWKVIEFAGLTKEGTLYDYRSRGNWPLLKEVWDDPVMEEPAPFFSNSEEVRKIYVEVAGNVTSMYFGPNWTEAYMIIQQVTTDYFSDLISAEDCLQQIEERLSNI